LPSVIASGNARRSPPAIGAIEHPEFFGSEKKGWNFLRSFPLRPPRDRSMSRPRRRREVPTASTEADASPNYFLLAGAFFAVLRAGFFLAAGFFFAVAFLAGFLAALANGILLSMESRESAHARILVHVSS
jgi:hypothetical protein